MKCELNSAGKINAGRPIKNKQYSMRETQRVTAQLLKDLDDYDIGVYLTAACHTMKVREKVFKI